MGRFYSVQLAPTAYTAATDLFEVTCAAERPVRVWGWFVFQTTELGDAAEEVVSLTLERGVTAGTGGASATVVSLDRETTADSTCTAGRTTAHSGGTVLFRQGWNVRVPMEHWFTPETAPTIDSATDPFTLTMSAPADSTTVGGCMVIEEL